MNIKVFKCLRMLHMSEEPFQYNTTKNSHQGGVCMRASCIPTKNEQHIYIYTNKNNIYIYVNTNDHKFSSPNHTENAVKNGRIVYTR